jgi:hypothetical protein
LLNKELSRLIPAGIIADVYAYYFIEKIMYRISRRLKREALNIQGRHNGQKNPEREGTQH